MLYLTDVQWLHETCKQASRLGVREGNHVLSLYWVPAMVVGYRVLDVFQMRPTTGGMRSSVYASWRVCRGLCQESSGAIW